ncbi:hypothetical protein UK15_13955 [Streptomyces variegatus]|uniref:Uncharacterized protein n=1 Tax=Streptomyces variegatus TaxID=284040 RepID=A0A0M2GU77_9ACTN|nr:hypothetical protein UK15_13955 [Streptomyces variegatus]
MRVRLPLDQPRPLQPVDEPGGRSRSEAGQLGDLPRGEGFGFEAEQAHALQIGRMQSQPVRHGLVEQGVRGVLPPGGHGDGREQPLTIID